MKYDQVGRLCVTTVDLCDMLYKNPNLELSGFLVADPVAYNTSVQSLYADMPVLQQYHELDLDVDQFDQQCQTQWFMPDQYKNMDIAQWVLDQCKAQAELQRVAQELFLFQERNLFPLLCYLKYLVDTMREHGVVWGVGRGSSVASYVLFLIGVHKIDSLYYDLPIDEFLKETNEKII
jgi:DNA polymerase III alpha subunit